MTPTTVNGVACACGESFRSFSAWESHREDCEHYDAEGRR